MKPSSVLTIVCSLLLATAAQAQRPQSDRKALPPDLRPPAGMCRIWLDGVSPSRQPAPTDCASALRNRPATGQVIFGDDYLHTDSDNHTSASPLKGVAPLPTSMNPKIVDSAHVDRKPDDKKVNSGKRTPAKRKPDSTVVNPFGLPPVLR